MQGRVWLKPMLVAFRRAKGRPFAQRKATWARCMAILLFAIVLPCVATEPEPQVPDQREAKRAQLLNQMKVLAESTDVRYQTGERRPKLVETPVFRYADQPRRFIDATMWVWTDGGRPVAFEKIEACLFDRAMWQYCFTSVSEALIKVEWEARREYKTAQPGIEFRPLPGAPLPSARPTERKRQARGLIRDFSARITMDPAKNSSEQMRLLPTPIYEYADLESKEPRGAVFGFATNGTNPDLLIVLEINSEAEQPQWRFGAARMTTGGLKVHYADSPVWEAEFVAPRPKAFPTWTFFSMPRSEPTTKEPE
jgi:hypothetical protein